MIDWILFYDVSAEFLPYDGGFLFIVLCSLCLLLYWFCMNGRQRNMFLIIAVYFIGVIINYSVALLNEFGSTINGRIADSTLTSVLTIFHSKQGINKS